MSADYVNERLARVDLALAELRREMGGLRDALSPNKSFTFTSTVESGPWRFDEPVDSPGEKDDDVSESLDRPLNVRIRRSVLLQGLQELLNLARDGLHSSSSHVVTPETVDGRPVVRGGPASTGGAS